MYRSNTINKISNMKKNNNKDIEYTHTSILLRNIYCPVDHDICHTITKITCDICPRNKTGDLILW